MMKEYQLQTFASSTERVRIKYIILEIAKGPAFCIYARPFFDYMSLILKGNSSCRLK